MDMGIEIAFFRVMSSIVSIASLAVIFAATAPAIRQPNITAQTREFGRCKILSKVSAGTLDHAGGCGSAPQRARALP